MANPKASRGPIIAKGDSRKLEAALIPNSESGDQKIADNLGYLSPTLQSWRDLNVQVDAIAAGTTDEVFDQFMAPIGQGQGQAFAEPDLNNLSGLISSLNYKTTPEPSLPVLRSFPMILIFSRRCSPKTR